MSQGRGHRDCCHWRRQCVGLARCIVAVLAVFSALVSQAQDSARWVTDEFEVTMRTGQSTRQSIVRMLASGARVELLGSDPESGYSRVRTRNGTEGWVLSRYLVRSPPARVTLPDTMARLEKADTRRREIEQQLATLKQERDQLQRELASTQQSGDGLQRELSEIRELSANAIELDGQNQRLRKRLLEQEQAIGELQGNNQRLASRSNREWFVVGAGVLIVGMLVGLILPRIRWRRKSSWGDL